jgi:hypothetical protein
MLERVVEIFRGAWNLELHSDVGKVNYRTLIVAAILGLVLIFPTDILDTILIALGHQALEKHANPYIIFSAVVVAGFLCNGMIYLAERATAEVPGATATPQVPDATATPQVPDATATPQVPDATATPQVPDATATPQVPDATAGASRRRRGKRGRGR